MTGPFPIVALPPWLGGAYPTAELAGPAPGHIGGSGGAGEAAGQLPPAIAAKPAAATPEHTSGSERAARESAEAAQKQAEAQARADAEAKAAADAEARATAEAEQRALNTPPTSSPPVIVGETAQPTTGGTPTGGPVIVGEKPQPTTHG